MLHRTRNISWTLFRYIVGETMFSFFVAFLFFFFIFFINQLLLMAEEILSKRVPFHQVLLLIFYSLPSIIAMAAPFASLVGTLMAVGRLSSDNEVLVMLSSGLSYFNLFIPALISGICISLLSFVANDILLPAGTLEFGRLYRRILVSTPALELEANSVKRYKDTIIVTGEATGTGISDVLIMDRTGEGERRLIIARDAQLGEDPGRNVLSLDLSNAFIHSAKENIRENYDYAQASKLRYSIMQKDLMQSIGNIGPREMSSRDVAREITIKKENVVDREEEWKKKYYSLAYNLEKTLRAGVDSDSWNRRTSYAETIIHEKTKHDEIIQDRNLQVYKLEYYKKFSIPFGALSFIFLSVPLGLFAKKSGQTVGFAIGLLLAVLYWALLIGGQTLGVRLSYNPFWAMWLPNISAIVVGLVLSFRRFKR